jgi:DNA-binding NtrC family response regulator
MQKLTERVAKASNARSVLLYGESGCGKEVVAHALHEQGDRKDKTLVTVHCGSVNSDLMTSALFGHEKGAFTGAHEQRVGAFEAADKGTVYLDEVSRLQREVQGMLLRALEGESFCRLGSTKSINADFRLIAATNRDLGAMVEKGEFAQDLYYRINAIPLRVPSLRERQDDVIRLARLFADQSGKSLDPETEKRLEKRLWPGNVRELRNVIERASVFSKDPDVIHSSDIEFDEDFSFGEGMEHTDGNILGPLDCGGTEGLLKIMSEFIETAMPYATGSRTVSDIVDEFMVRAVIASTTGNKLETSKILGLGRQTIYNKLRRYQITAQYHQIAVS